MVWGKYGLVRNPKNWDKNITVRNGLLQRRFELFEARADQTCQAIH